MDEATTSPIINYVNLIGGWEAVYGILATIIGVYLAKKNITFKKVIKEMNEFTQALDMATRPDSKDGEKISLEEGKRIAYEGKDVILAFKELLAKVK